MAIDVVGGGTGVVNVVGGVVNVIVPTSRFVIIVVILVIVERHDDRRMFVSLRERMSMAHVDVQVRSASVLSWTKRTFVGCFDWSVDDLLKEEEEEESVYENVNDNGATKNTSDAISCL